MPKIVRSILRDGVWYGEISDLQEGQEVSATVRDNRLPNIRVGIAGDNYRVAVPIPSQYITEGVNTFILVAGEENFGSFTIVAGDVVADDLMTEVELLRAELDMLKKAFRRHLRETI